MWSYKDAQGKVITRLHSSTIRTLIRENTIREETPLLNSQFNKWIPAKDTLFFKTIEGELPTAKSNGQRPHLFSEQANSVDKRNDKKPNFFQPILIALLTLFAILPISYQLVKIYKKEHHFNELQEAFINHQDLLNDQKIAKEAYIAAKAKYRDLQQIVSSTEGAKLHNEKEQREHDLTKNQMLQAETYYKNFNFVEAQTTLPASIKRVSNELSSMRKITIYYAYALLPLYLYSLLMHFKACKTLFKRGKGYLFLWILHSIPLLQFFFYALLSAKWNLVSTQRKNSLYYTLPLSIALLVSLAFSFYFFYLKTSHSLILLLFCIILWAILQLRQIAMVDYASK